ncbi:unnamed protein product [Cuscuta europaea]|uniref:Uncharacterized protein n=1 Tax=Cuscuta europaea TaxID=41803 RepID=A0A9P1E074_CUSEU|nr:unnamed protein product [Cuscuta europaea]
MKSFGVFLFSLMTALATFSLLLGCSEGRPLDILKVHGASTAVLGGVGNAWGLDWLTLGAVKGGGPSPGGAGHRFFTDGGVKNSGPSPGGAGHRFFTDGGIKNSGPSPGDGHRVVAGKRQ